MSDKIINAVISGGASGLGLAAAKSVIARGGKVALLDINQAAGEAAVAELGDNANFYMTDISDEQAVDNAFDSAAQAMGSITLAVNCAGVLGAGKLVSKKGVMEASYFKKVIDINLMGSFLFSRAAAKHMLDNDLDSNKERGVIIHTASIAAYEGQVGQVAYSATKSAIVGMILPLAREFGRSAIRFMAIAPGMFETAMMASVTPEIRDQLASNIPFPSRFGHADEFGHMVMSIFDNQMLNGSVVRLDGAVRLQ
jgi:NAD(P)-dependent dehydrogenase (short-subunit alcohol dehydrogenase family)